MVLLLPEDKKFSMYPALYVCRYVKCMIAVVSTDKRS